MPKYPFAAAPPHLHDLVTLPDDITSSLKTSTHVRVHESPLFPDMSEDTSVLGFHPTGPLASALHQPASTYHANMTGHTSPTIPSAEKLTDNPNQKHNPRLSLDREHTSTPTRLNRLFASPPSPVSSREHSFTQANLTKTYMRSLTTETPPLHIHLYSRGLMSGRHSDITVKVFNKDYALHRIILDRAPFFASALSEPWLEASSKEISLRPEDADTNITQSAFEVALMRLYGCDEPSDQEVNHCALLATGSWLEMQDIVLSSTDAILKSMNPRNLGQTIQFATNSYYGRPGEKILASAKAMLCRDGWAMPVAAWDTIPGDIVREIVGGDSLYIPDEWQRFQLARRILDRRLKHLAAEASLTSSVPPRSLLSKAIRIRPATKTSTTSSKVLEDTFTELSLDLHEPSTYDWLTLYGNADVEALMMLLDEGIYYTHLGFEHLQEAKSAVDCFGIPLLPDGVVSNALWKSVELRQTILNAQEGDEGLGLSKSIPTTESPEASSHELREDVLNAFVEPGPRRFWIPSTDCNITVGGTGDPVVTASGSSTHKLSPQSKSSIGHNEAVQWFSDFIKERSQAATSTRPTSYSTLPPFRFAVEFPNPRSLKEKKRVYSQTVFYAGSFWNVYIQKVKSNTKNPQLGVYLHRARGTEMDELSTSGTRHSVENRIGALEREMRHRHGHNRTHSNANDDHTALETHHDETAGGTTLMSENTLQRPQNHTEKSSGEASNILRPRLSSSLPSIPALPPYTDTRPTIKTYFKIYSPSKGGRMLSVYESAPDSFNFHQSWGWKSSTLMLDEGLSLRATLPGSGLGMSDGIEEIYGGTDDDDVNVSVFESTITEDELRGLAASRRDGRLRFMVVLGVV